MKWAFQQVNSYDEKEINCAKKCYDQNVKCSALASSDLVLVCVKAFKGKHKVSDQWESVPYDVVRHIRDDLPVYEVRKKIPDLQSLVLHQNMLIPLIQWHKSELSEIVPVDLHTWLTAAIVTMFVCPVTQVLSHVVQLRCKEH